jgi:hypothetical protein
MVLERTIDRDHLTRMVDGICSQRGTPTMIRSGDDAVSIRTNIRSQAWRMSGQ